MSSNRTDYDKSLNFLLQELLRMASIVEEAIADAVESLAKQNTVLAEKVIGSDAEVDALQLQIEDHCIKLIATQQPLAKDLRKITTALKIGIDLERMADNAVDIAKIAKRIAGQPLIKPLIDIPRMAEISQKMVKDGLDAYVKEDVELARAMCAKDDQVDHLYKQVFRELLTYMLEDPKTIAQATHLLFVARYLERIADHATNIGESVVYLVTGEHIDLND